MDHFTEASRAMHSRRTEDLRTFYEAIERLQTQLGGARTLESCNGKLNWPRRGVYFFMEQGEVRSNSGDGPRIVRVGTHALKADSKTKLWTRLSQHRGQASTGTGNHRGSIFRLIVGASLMERNGYTCPTWGDKKSVTAEIKNGEISLESEVSKVIGAMPFLWLSVDDQPGAESVRGFIERNSIALLSNYGKETLDAPSSSWLGLQCDREKVRRSGLWNSNHVDESYDPAFLSALGDAIHAMGQSR
jgi:hypothetical protein